MRPVLEREAYLDKWTELHGGYDPRGSVIVRGWLVGVYAVVRPLARIGVGPSIVTFLGLLAGGGVVLTAEPDGSRLVIAAAGLCVLSGILDNADGALAAATGRATLRGYVLDSVVDRGTDVLYLVALWRIGAPTPLVVAAGIMLGMLEYLRARAGSAGMDEIGVVTLGERPTRIIVTATALLGAGIHTDHVIGFATYGAAATLGVCTVGFLQLALVVRRALR